MPDHDLIGKLSQNDSGAFNHLVERFYTDLCRFALKYTRVREPAEEIVQDVFVALWNKRRTLEITVSLSAYLHAAVKYRCLNYLKSEFRNPRFESIFPESVISRINNADEEIAGRDLERVITSALNTLPKKCRIIFDLSRNAGLTYREIASKLGISQKTVETQMTVAFSKIRAFLGPHWNSLISLLLSLLFL